MESILIVALFCAPSPRLASANLLADFYDVLAEAIRERIRNVLVVQARVELAPWGSLRRSEYKSRLVER